MKSSKEKIKESFRKDINLFLLRLFPDDFNEKYGIPWYLRLIYHVVLVLKLKKMCIVIPRFHAKTTGVTFGLVMYLIVHKLKRSIVLIGNKVGDGTSGSTNFLERISFHLKNNKKLRYYYGDLTSEYIGEDYEEEEFIIGNKKQKSKKWSSKTIRCSNGVTVSVLGSLSAMRGLLQLGIRPDLVIGDDIEDKKNTNTRTLRQALLRWWYDVPMKLGAESTQYFYIGTILHHDSIPIRLHRNPKWWSIFLRGMMTDAEVEELNETLPDGFKWNPTVSLPNDKSKNMFAPYRHIIWPERKTYRYFKDEWEDAHYSGVEDSFWQEIFNIPRSEKEKVFTTFPTIDFEIKDMVYA